MMRSWLLAGLWLFALSAGLAAPPGPLDSPPKLLQSVTPEYPAALRAQQIVGDVDLRCLIDENGEVRNVKVEGASRDEFGQAAATAVRQFKYQAAVKNGRPQAIEVRIPIEFTLSDADLAELESHRTVEMLPPGPPVVPAAEVDELPNLKKEIHPVTPYVLRQSLRIGQTIMAFIVDEGGVPRDIHLVVTTHAECARAAADAISHWKFSTGSKDGQVVRVALEVPFIFYPENTKASGLRVRPGVSREIITRYKNVPVREDGSPDLVNPLEAIEEVDVDFPEEMAERGKAGEATVDFVINPSGVVTHVHARRATNQYFAVAAERAISYWRFKPATVNGGPVWVHGVQTVVFHYHD